MEGFKKKPVFIEIFALIYLLNPIGNLLYMLFWNSALTPGEVFEIFTGELAKGNIIFIVTLFLWISAIPLAYGLHKVRLWAWYYFLVHSISMVVLSIVDRSNTTSVISLIINILFLLPIGYFISREIRTAYFNPRVRWWEQADRYQYAFKVIVDGVTYETFDFSMTGVFVKSDGKNMLPNKDSFKIKIIIDNSNVLECNAEIRWENTVEGSTPQGWGMKFLDMKRSDKMILKDFVEELEDAGKHSRR